MVGFAGNLWSLESDFRHLAGKWRMENVGGEKMGLKNMHVDLRECTINARGNYFAVR